MRPNNKITHSLLGLFLLATTTSSFAQGFPVVPLSEYQVQKLEEHDDALRMTVALKQGFKGFRLSPQEAATEIEVQITPTTCAIGRMEKSFVTRLIVINGSEVMMSKSRVQWQKVDGPDQSRREQTDVILMYQREPLAQLVLEHCEKLVRTTPPLDTLPAPPNDNLIRESK